MPQREIRRKEASILFGGRCRLDATSGRPILHALAKMGPPEQTLAQSFGRW
jgi:hypothetical protein